MDDVAGDPDEGAGLEGFNERFVGARTRRTRPRLQLDTGD